MDGPHSHLISVAVVRGVRQRIRALGTAFLFAVLVCGAYAAEKEIVEAPVAFMFPVGPASIEAIVTLKLPQDLGIPVLGWIPPMYKPRSPVNPFVSQSGRVTTQRSPSWLSTLQRWE